VTVGAGAEILACTPIRLADWRADGSGRVVVERPKPRARGVTAILANLRWLMSHPRLRLDELGSFVWQRLEGGETLAEIAAATAAAFPDRAEGIEERLALFATALHHQALIELVVPSTP
jgi:hypothetical protein